MKRLVIDLDDVITNCDGWFYVLNKFLGTNYTENDIKTYYIQDLVPDNKKKEYTQFFINYNTYDHCKLNDDCTEVLKELNEKYDVYICSAYIFRDDVMYSADALKYKFEFLMDRFPFMDPNKFIFLTNKSIIDCDIRIDDKINNLDNAELKLLYTAYHNKDISDEELEKQGIKRVNGWKEIKEILL